MKTLNKKYKCKKIKLIDNLIESMQFSNTSLLKTIRHFILYDSFRITKMNTKGKYFRRNEKQ